MIMSNGKQRFTFSTYVPIYRNYSFKYQFKKVCMRENSDPNLDIYINTYILKEFMFLLMLRIFNFFWKKKINKNLRENNYA